MSYCLTRAMQKRDNFLMKLFTLITLTFICTSLFGSDSVRINDPSNLIVTGTISGISFTLGSDSPSGDGTSESAPAKVYLPINNIPTNNQLYSTLKVTSGLSSLFNIGSTSEYVSFPLLMTIGSTAKYLYIAVRGGATGTSYYVSGKSTSTYSNISSSLINFSINPKDICKSVIVNNISTVCNALTGALDPNSISSVLFKPMLYFFVTDQVLAVDGTSVIDPANANFSGGIYFESQMSNRIFTSSDLVVSLSALRKGDARLLGTFSGSSTMDSTLFKKVIVYQYSDTSTPIVANLPIGSATLGALVNKDISTEQSGDFTFSGLTNSQTYKISLAFEDKFLFATTLSTSQAGTPTEIQELLKKQACYLLTAGFGEEHYIISFFRQYRDQILANSWIGRKFIKVYYSSAPHYAVIIYQSQWMRLVIRSIAYLLYFFFNFYWTLLLICLTVVFINLRRNKILFSNNRL